MPRPSHPQRLLALTHPLASRLLGDRASSWREVRRPSLHAESHRQLSPHLLQLGRSLPAYHLPGLFFPAATFLHVHRRLLIPRNSSSSKPLLPSFPRRRYPISPEKPSGEEPSRHFTSTYLSLNSHFIPTRAPSKDLRRCFAQNDYLSVSFTQLRVFHMFHGLHVNSLPGFHPPLQTHNPLPAPRPNTEPRAASFSPSVVYTQD